PDTPGQSLVESLKTYLHDKHMLLLLDNFEQVLDAAPLVAQLLADTATLKILVTSRESLHLYGEKNFPVPPLALSDHTHPASLKEFDKYEAIDLFVQRAMLMN